MYYLPNGTTDGRSPGNARVCNRIASHVTVDSGVEEAARGRESSIRRSSKLSGERRTRGLRINETWILVPVDGSKTAEGGVRHVISLSRTGMPVKVHLLNVQAEWAPPRSEDEKREGAALQVSAADQATRSARGLLTGAGLHFETHLRIGVVADEIVRLAREKRCQHIVMGTRRLGTVAGFLFGSVARTVVGRTAVPVTLVRKT